MKKEEAYKILLSYNAWRRGSEIEMPSPYIIGEAIDVAIKELSKECEHPYAFVLEGEPQKCLSCGKILSE